ncbi:MAG: hypothetical protein JW754_01870 [Candidatus Aenigmarchaeota archaeon]|nr:hypothetical protein [Candidatus Aenigmarchaeota archaeon]
MTLIIAETGVKGPKRINDKYLEENFTPVGFNGCHLTSTTPVDAQEWSYKCKPNNEGRKQTIRLQHDQIIMSDGTLNLGHYCPSSQGIGNGSCGYMGCMFNSSNGVFYLENKKGDQSRFKISRIAAMF